MVQNVSSLKELLYLLQIENNKFMGVLLDALIYFYGGVIDVVLK